MLKRAGCISKATPSLLGRPPPARQSRLWPGFGSRGTKQRKSESASPVLPHTLRNVADPAAPNPAARQAFSRQSPVINTQEIEPLRQVGLTNVSINSPMHSHVGFLTTSDPDKGDMERSGLAVSREREDEDRCEIALPLHV